MPFSSEINSEIVSLLILVVVMLITVYVLVWLGQRLVRRYVEDATRVYHANKLIRRIGGTVAVVLLFLFLVPDLNILITVLTVIGAGLAIALREALLSFVGWFRITLNSPFKMGDRIEIKQIRGDVIDIRVLRTTLMEIGNWVDADQSTGRIVHIPNSWIFQYGLYNYSRGFNFIWNEMAMTVSFRSDWQAAQEIMLSLGEVSAAIVEQQATKEIHEMSREFLIHYSILTPFVYVHVANNGIRLTLRYLCEARKRRGTEHALTISILEDFKSHPNIELAYPMMGVSMPDTNQFGPIPDRGTA